MPLCPLRQYYQIIISVNPRQRISNNKCYTAKLNVRAKLHLKFSMRTIFRKGPLSLDKKC